MRPLDYLERQLARVSEEHFYLALLLAAVLMAFASLAPFGLAFHANFLSNACDTAAFQSAIVNTLNGFPFRDTAYDGPNILGQHSFFIFLFIAPIYELFPGVETLFLLQFILVYSAVIPLYLVAVELLKRPALAFVLALSALISPLLLHLALSSFHPEAFTLTAVFWSLFFALKNKPRCFWCSILLAFSCGEQAVLVYFCLGLGWWLVQDKARPWQGTFGLWAMAASIGWLVFVLVLLFPFMHVPGQTNVVAYHYAQWKVQNGEELIVAVVRAPLEALSYLLSPHRWYFLLELIGVPLLLAFCYRISLLLLAPFPFYFLISNQEFHLYFHAYYFQFAFVAGYLALMLFWQKQRKVNRLGWVVLTTTVLGNILILINALPPYLEPFGVREEVLNRAIHEAFTHLPAEAGVYGPHRFSAYLTNHPRFVMGDCKEENFDFEKSLRDRQAFTMVSPEQIDFIVSDLANDQCGVSQFNFSQEYMNQRSDNLKKMVQSGQWKVFWSQEPVVILQRVKPGEEKPVLPSVPTPVAPPD